MNEEIIKIVVGLALAKAYHESPRSIQILKPIWDSQRFENLENTIGQLTSSDDSSMRRVGFILQAVVQNSLSEPEPIQWRDMALDIAHQQVLLVDYMYRIGEFSNKEKNPQKKQTLDKIYTVLQTWQDYVWTTVSKMRESNWIEAKVSIDLAYEVSCAKEMDSLIRLYSNYRSAIEEHRKDAERFRTIVLGYPSKIRIPIERTDTIFQGQSILLSLLQIRAENEKDREVLDSVRYSIEKLTHAIDYLLSQTLGVESANREINLAISDLNEKINVLRNEGVKSKLEEIQDRLKLLFSALPTKP